MHIRSNVVCANAHPGNRLVTSQTENKDRYGMNLLIVVLLLPYVTVQVRLLCAGYPAVE
jgi:hypothetical protein